VSVGTNATFPIFVDGQKICESTNLSWSIKSPVRFAGSGQPGPTVAEHDPPEYTIEAELPSSDIYAPISYDSHVEVGMPPITHAASGWRVIEVWEINQYEITAGEFSLSAYQGRVVDGVNTLGSDTDRAVGGEKQIETSPGATMRIENEAESSDSVSDTDDTDISATVHDI